MPSTAPELTVTVKLYATLRECAPAGADPRGFPVVLPAGATVGALAGRLRLPRRQRGVAFRNSVQCPDAEALGDGDVIAFFPPIAGG
jgi:molybdopterin converting factor small subunit